MRPTASDTHPSSGWRSPSDLRLCLIRARLTEFAASTGVQDVMVTGMVFDIEDRIGSLEITAEAVGLT